MFVLVYGGRDGWYGMDGRAIGRVCDFRQGPLHAEVHCINLIIL